MAVTYYVGVGSNLTNFCGDAPIASCRQAIAQIVSRSNHTLVGSSYFYRSAPIPRSAQPDYINAVISMQAQLTPLSFLHFLQGIERSAGRVRGERNAARVLDLDLVAADGLVLAGSELTVPHPRMAERAFVLVPFCDIAPDWLHPLLGLTASALRDRLDMTGQRIERLDTNEGLPWPGGALK